MNGLFGIESEKSLACPKPVNPRQIVGRVGIEQNRALSQTSDGNP
jgi:hypothetical protein